MGTDDVCNTGELIEKYQHRAQARRCGGCTGSSHAKPKSSCIPVSQMLRHAESWNQIYPIVLGFAVIAGSTTIAAPPVSDGQPTHARRSVLS